jgi:hypothetical protein
MNSTQTNIAQREWETIVLGVLIAALAIALFHFHGVTDAGYAQASASPSMFIWIMRRWVPDTTYQNDFPYGWAAPLASLWMVWRLRNELRDAKRSPSWTGFALILLALLIHWAGARMQQTRISIAAFLLLAWAIPLHICGWRTARILLAPTLLLAFSCDVSFLEPLSTRARFAVAQLAAGLTNALGMSAQSNGALVQTSGGTTVDLLRSVGGLRSAMIVTGCTFVFAWARLSGLPKKIILLALAPVATLLASVSSATLVCLAGTDAILRFVPAFFYCIAFSFLFATSRQLGRPRSAR